MPKVNIISANGKHRKIKKAIQKSHQVRLEFDKKDLPILRRTRGLEFLEVESPEKRVKTVKRFNEDRKQLMKIFTD